MRALHRSAESTQHVRVVYSCSITLAVMVLSMNATSVRADIYRCIGADGTNTFSDHACEVAPKSDDSSALAHNSPAHAGEDIYARRPDSLREKKAARILDVLRIAPAAPEGMLMSRTVDEAAPDLVKSVDPDNGLWTPANARWRSVSDFVKADLRRDVQTTLRSSAAQVSQVAARQYAVRASDADMDALSAFLATPEGARYIAFQNEIRPLLYAALASVEAQEPQPENTASESVLAQRRRLLFMTLEYRIMKDGGGPPGSPLQPGSMTVLENAVLREGATLDTLQYEYEPFLPSLQAFSDSATMKHFFAAVEPALRTQLALSSAATTDFAEQEFGKYLQRWRGFYGPMRVTTRTTVTIRGRVVLIAHSVTTRILPGVQSPEAMAIQFERTEEGVYQATHRLVDYNVRAAAVKAIQNRCRAEQRLPPL
jgi:hypothetical protein